MNLLELSAAIGLPSDGLKAMIAERFQVIVLSGWCACLPQSLRLQSDLHRALGSRTPSPSITRPVDDGKAVLLEQLEQALMPELIYTRKLLDYCMCEKFLIIIDLCSLLHEQFYAFYDSATGISERRAFGQSPC